MIDSTISKLMRLMGVVLCLTWVYDATLAARFQDWFDTFWLMVGGVVAAAAITGIWCWTYYVMKDLLGSRKRSDVAAGPISVTVAALVFVVVMGFTAVGLWATSPAAAYKVITDGFIPVHGFMWCANVAAILGIGGWCLADYFFVSNFKNK